MNKLTSIISRQYNQILSLVSGYYQPILDFSRYQYPVNFDIMWERGVRLICLRLSVGNYYKDTRFEEFYLAARGKGFHVGAYHVTKPSISVNAQWAWILQCLEAHTLDFFVLDNELDDGKTPAQISGVIEGLTINAKAHFGVWPVQYLRGEWWNTY